MGAAAGTLMFLSPMLDRPGDTFELVNLVRGTTVASRLDAAFDSKSRNRGLLGRDGLAEGHALIIAPCNSIHMFFMRFAIDVIFLARDGRVVKVRENLRPWRIALARKAFAVVEGPDGMIRTTRTRPGDQLAVRSTATAPTVI